MTIAFVFPGQATNAEDGIHEWRAASQVFRELLDVADGETHGSPPPRGAGAGSLAGRDTALLQPRVTALCLAIVAELEVRGLRPDIVAGHSLGEVSACSAAGCIDHVTAVRVAAARGRLMAREAVLHPGGMLALTASDRSVANEAVAEAQRHGQVTIAAHNAFDQWVVSGEWAALRSIAARLDAATLPVVGAWHSEAMAGAVEEYREILGRALTMPIRVPLVCNRTGAIVERVEELTDLLALQLTHPVEWVATMGTLSRFGITDIVAVGPAKAIRGLLRRGLDRRIAIHAVESPDDLAGVAGALT